MERSEHKLLAELTPHPVTAKKYSEVSGCGVNSDKLMKNNKAEQFTLTLVA